MKPGQLTQTPAHVVIDMGFGGDDTDNFSNDTQQQTQPQTQLNMHTDTYMQTDAVLHRRNHGSGRVGSRVGKAGRKVEFLSTYRPSVSTTHRRNTTLNNTQPQLASPVSTGTVGLNAGSGSLGGLKESGFIRPPRPAYLTDYKRPGKSRKNEWAMSVKQKIQAMSGIPQTKTMSGYESDDAINSLAHRGRVVMKKGSLEWVFDISQDTHGRTPLHIAAAKGDLQSVLTILEAKYDDPSTGSAEDHDEEMVVGSSINRRREYAMGRTKSFDAGVLNVNVNARDRMGNTPLHMAACTANMGVMTELVRHGADPGLIDGRGKLPMHYVESRLMLLGKTIDSTSKTRFLEIYRFLQACNTTRDLGCSGALLKGANGMGVYMGTHTPTQNVEDLEAEDLAALLNGMVSMSLSRPENGD